MKRVILTIVFICITNLSFGQLYEVGGFVGATNFIGDIGRTNYIYPNAVGGGVVFKYNTNPRVAFRANYNYLNIKGDDTNSSNPYRKLRGINFTNNIHEFALGTEINFLEYNIIDRETAYTPYILAQVSLFSYNSPQSLNTTTLTTKRSTSYTIPVGLGFKGRITDNIAFAIESGVRFTFVDDLDYTSGKINPLNQISKGNGFDHYVFTGFSVVYAFGRPPCFSSRH